MPDGWGMGRGGGRPAGTFTSPNRERAFELFEQGQTDSEVADLLGISRTRVGDFRADYLKIKSPT